MNNITFLDELEMFLKNLETELGYNTPEMYKNYQTKIPFLLMNVKDETSDSENEKYEKPYNIFDCYKCM